MGEQHLHPSSNADQFSAHHRIGRIGNPFHPGRDFYFESASVSFG